MLFTHDNHNRATRWHTATSTSSTGGAFNSGYAIISSHGPLNKLPHTGNATPLLSVNELKLLLLLLLFAEMLDPRHLVEAQKGQLLGRVGVSLVTHSAIMSTPLDAPTSLAAVR